MLSGTRDMKRRGVSRIQPGRFPDLRIIALQTPSRLQWPVVRALPDYSDEFAQDSHLLPFSPDAQRPAPAVYSVV